MRIAAKVRIEKEKFPERFCHDPRCLWRIWTREGTKPCPKHMRPSSSIIQESDEELGA